METTAAPPSVDPVDRIKRFLHVIIEPRSWLNALYLLISLPLGLTYFAVLVGGALTGAFLSVVIVGLLIMLAVLVAAWFFALLERELVIGLLRIPVAPLSLPDSEVVSPWTMLVRHLRKPETWRSLAYLLMKLPFGTSDRAVWDAVRDHTGYVVLDTSMLDARNGNPATIVGIKSTDSTFQPFQVQMTGGGKQGTSSTRWTLTVVGFMSSSDIWNGTYVSTRTAMQSALFAAADTAGTPSGSPAGALGAALPALSPTGYYFALKPGVDINKARLDLGGILVKDQLEPVILADQLAQQLSGILTLLNLVTGFLALGLIVGIAGLGVISTRAVVERWQQIGMLRALGYRRSLVQQSFLMESSLIAILGLIIGALVGVWQSYRFFVTDMTFGPGVVFHVPVVQIILILGGAYLATLLTTYLPARSASRIAPAEALRYE